VHGSNYLTSIGMTPFLIAARLADKRKRMFSQNSDDFFGIVNWIVLAHGRATSNNLALLLILTGLGSNHNFSASFALAMASSSVLPAAAQPGNSGNTADHRFVSGSNSTSKRNFI